MIELEYAEGRFEGELLRCDWRLQGIVYALARWLNAREWPGLVLTSVLRTPGEQTAIYGYAKPSPHLDGRAADFRSSVYSPEQLRGIDEFVSATWATNIQDTLIIHDVGRGIHAHIQVPRRRGMIG